MMKIITALAVSLGLAACVSAFPSFDSPYQASVEITRAGSDYCSGTMISQGETIVTALTAGHCTTASDPTVYALVTEQCGPLPVIAAVGTQDGTDVGLMVAVKPATCTVDVASVASSLTLGEPVVVVGFPAPLGKTVAFGTVASLMNMIGDLRANVFQLAGGPGNSGSSIFNSDGEIVGVLTGPASDGFGLIRGSTIEDIKAFIDASIK